MLANGTITPEMHDAGGIFRAHFRSAALDGMRTSQLVRVSRGAGGTLTERHVGARAKIAGALADARVTETGCTELGGRPDRFAGARLDFHSLAPAAAGTPDAVATAWRAVQLRNSRPMELDRGDCELVEQFRVHHVLVIIHSQLVEQSHVHLVPEIIHSQPAEQFHVHLNDSRVKVDQVHHVQE